ncbi:response regulator [Anaerobium acetethylicum]|uniref:Stage 0 sporulation protein A homolog n=1 Tax=Anaerobium acetethylicum TaxID=1619234 RepID=A0A1D3TP49_9FIRM|nr:response regulator [Anaerobium acetethylicum]SCP95117.1 two-component system, chemotaxis family, response regulator CheY [Anaerobium acetethylicum]
MDFSTIKILITDDSVLARKKLKDYLASLGCQHIYEVSDGQQAIDSYKINKPDLVFLDIIMPVKDGITVVNEILEFDPKARVVMASSVGTQSYLKEALKAGAIDFLQKPLDNELVKKVVLNAIGGQK